MTPTLEEVLTMLNRDQLQDMLITRGIRAAERPIEDGKSHYYDEAVGRLRLVKQAYMQQGDRDGWTNYLHDLKQRHGRKRKLMSLMEGM